MIIAIEGMDGSGKTTQAKLLTKKLKERGYEAKYIETTFFLLKIISSLVNRNIEDVLPSPRKNKVNEKDSSKSNKIIRKILIGISGYFYALITVTIIAIRYHEKIVICDRFFYQFFYDLFQNKSLKILNHFPKPDIVFLLDIDLNEARSRMTDSFDKNTDNIYFVNVRKFFYILSDEFAFTIIKSSGKIEEVNNEIMTHLEENKVI